MATIRKKICVEAASRWTESTNFFVIMISVTHEDGSPVTSLTKSNFNAGRYGGAEFWHSFQIASVNTEASSRGFYSFLHFADPSDPGGIPMFKAANKDFTIEVTKELTKGGNNTIFHGQCIVAMNPTEILEFA
jgi:hypothetical protein